MKNKKIIRLFTAALAVALCATAFAVPAFAGGGEGEPYYTETAGTEADPAEDAEAPEVTITDEEDPAGDDSADNSKGRILRTGESQRKDGRYAYKYTDACGKTQFVYAWKLVPTDKTPTGKRDDISLREKVKEILRDLNDGIDTIGKKMTVCQLYARQNSHRKNVKRSTEKGREYLMSVLKSAPLGSRSIDTVKLSDAKEWAIRMSEKGYAYKTINNWKRSLKAAFYTAIEDDCIRKNPFNFAMDTVLEDDTEEKVALTQEQEDRLLAFAGSDPVYRKYCDEIIVLLGTGLRVSELCGLTVDLDFENRRMWTTSFCGTASSATMWMRPRPRTACGRSP